MAAHLHSQSILAAVAVTEDTTGTTYEIKRVENAVDPVDEWIVVGSLTQSGTGGGATASMRLETSCDKVSWFQFPLEGGATDADETVYVRTAVTPCRYVRAAVDKLTGTPTLTARLSLAWSSGDYQVVAV